MTIGWQDGHAHAEPNARPPRPLSPPFPLLWRGLLLALVSICAAGLALAAPRRLGPAGLLLAPLPALAALLAAWAAAIELTGGPETDDHPWV